MRRERRRRRTGEWSLLPVSLRDGHMVEFGSGWAGAINIILFLPMYYFLHRCHKYYTIFAHVLFFKHTGAIYIILFSPIPMYYFPYT